MPIVEKSLLYPRVKSKASMGFRKPFNPEVSIELPCPESYTEVGLVLHDNLWLHFVLKPEPDIVSVIAGIQLYH